MPHNNWLDDTPLNKIKRLSHLRNSLLQWKNFVFSCRNDTNEEYDNYDLISGPILRNPNNLRRAEDCRFLGDLSSERVPYQTAVRSSDLCNKLRLSIVGILFFQRGLNSDIIN